MQSELIPGHCEKGVDQPMKAWAGALQWPGISNDPKLFGGSYSF